MNIQSNFEMITRNCPVCGSTKKGGRVIPENFDFAKLDAFAFASRKTPELMHYRLVSCLACDLLYASPVPAATTLTQAYHDAAFDSQEEARYASRTYARYLAQIARRLPELRGALDIGTGDGAFLEQLVAYGFSEIRGVEPSLAPIEQARSDIRPLITHGVFEDLQIRPASLSLVTCFQTFEHLSEPAKVCDLAKSYLRPGGALYIVVHNHRALSARLLGAKSPIFDIEHLQLFSPRSAREMLERAGFIAVQVRPIWNRYPLRYWLRLLPLPRPIKSLFFKTLDSLHAAHWPLLLPAGNLLAVGFKP